MLRLRSLLCLFADPKRGDLLNHSASSDGCRGANRPKPIDIKPLSVKLNSCLAFAVTRLAWLDIQHLNAKIQSFPGQRVIEIQNHGFFFDLMDAKIKVFALSPADLNGGPDF